MNLPNYFLVDLPPDELLQRLQEGKVYVEQKVRLALESSAEIFATW